MKRYRVTIDGRIYEVEIDDPRARPVTARLSGTAYSVDVEPLRGETSPDRLPPATRPAPAPPPERAAAPDAAGGPRAMTAPIPGVVTKVTATVGQVVERGDELLTIEAMKMFNVMRSPWAGTVATVHVKTGDQVVQGQPLVTITPR